MQETPVFRLAGLDARGGKFRFATAKPAVFRGPPGAEAEFVLVVGYEEDSPQREHFRVTFTAEFDGRSLGTRKAKFRDIPLYPDAERRALVFHARLPAEGSARGSFEVTATYAKGPWLGKAKTAATLTRKGTFRVEVGPPKAAPPKRKPPAPKRKPAARKVARKGR